MDDREIRDILATGRRIAIIGLSPREERDSHRVGRYLQEQGYRILPVNPTVPEVLGEKSWPSLSSIPEAVDIVDVFRRSEEVPAIVDEAIRHGARVLWLQEGISHPEAEARARAAGLAVIADRCIMKEHRRLAGA